MEAEVGHGSRRCPDIQGVAWGNQHYFDAVALVWSEQGLILTGVAIRMFGLARLFLLGQFH
jgi:hypothetical protein